MDNITHSLIGVAIGQGMRGVAGKSDGRKPDRVLLAALVAAIFSSNAPDLDVVGRYLAPRQDGLGFLLQHRGYTHGFLLAPVLAALAAILAWLCTPREKRAELSWRGLFAIGLVGVLLHIGADLWNDYGIHPLSPFFNRWFYGDFIFIVEPMLWFALLPLLIWQTEFQALRILGALLWLGGLGAAWFGPVSGVGTSVWLTAWALGTLALGLRWKSWRSAVATVLLMLALFFTGSRLARRQMKAAVGLEPATPALVASSPFPGNPLLWRGIVAWVKDGTYTAQPLTLSLVPSWFPPPKDFLRFGTQPESSIDPAKPGVRRLDPFEGSAAELQALAKRYCRVRGILGFVRFPYWHQAGGKIEIGDLRYGHRGGGRGFAQIDVAEDSGENCPEYYTPWTPPISALIPIH